MAITLMDCCKVFWAIFLPPIAVCLHRGCCTCSFLINICLTILGWIPGIVHAFCVISDCDIKSEGAEYDEESAHGSPQQPQVVVVASEGENVDVKGKADVTVVSKSGETSQKN